MNGGIDPTIWNGRVNPVCEFPQSRTYDESLVEIYSLLHQYGTPKTKQYIESLHIPMLGPERTVMSAAVADSV